MPSPFPGMDPYLETPALWEDFHDGFITFVKRDLNSALPDPLYAQVGHRTELEITSEDGDRDVNYKPAVAVLSPDVGGSVATLTKTDETLSESIAVAEPAEEVEVPFIEIRDSRSGHELLTVVEVMSPRNKRRVGEVNRDNYARKRNDLLHGRVSLVEIDLLRSGHRGVWGEAAIQTYGRLTPPPEYAVLVSRGHASPEGPRVSLFPAWIDRPLPVVPVPLRQGEPELPLNLQEVFAATYEAGPYRRFFREYPPQPDPPLPADRAEWLRSMLGAAS